MFSEVVLKIFLKEVQEYILVRTSETIHAT